MAPSIPPLRSEANLRAIKTLGTAGMFATRDQHRRATQTGAASSSIFLRPESPNNCKAHIGPHCMTRFFLVSPNRVCLCFPEKEEHISTWWASLRFPFTTPNQGTTLAPYLATRRLLAPCARARAVCRFLPCGAWPWPAWPGSALGSEHRGLVSMVQKGVQKGVHMVLVFVSIYQAAILVHLFDQPYSVLLVLLPGKPILFFVQRLTYAGSPVNVFCLFGGAGSHFGLSCTTRMRIING